MKHSVRSLIGYAIGATNGELGKIKEFNGIISKQ